MWDKNFPQGTRVWVRWDRRWAPAGPRLWASQPSAVEPVYTSRLPPGPGAGPGYRNICLTTGAGHSTRLVVTVRSCSARNLKISKWLVVPVMITCTGIAVDANLWPRRGLGGVLGSRPALGLTVPLSGVSLRRVGPLWVQPPDCLWCVASASWLCSSSSSDRLGIKGRLGHMTRLGQSESFQG